MGREDFESCRGCGERPIGSRGFLTVVRKMTSSLGAVWAGRVRRLVPFGKSSLSEGPIGKARFTI